MVITTDFHTHILPGVDDGAKTLADSLVLLREELRQGVGRVVLSPHCYLERQSAESFCSRRDAAAAALREAVRENALPIELTLAAEVRFSPKILDCDIDRLCIEGTSYILIEFPTTHVPSTVEQVFFELTSCGYTPILVHAERYPIENRSNYLYELVLAGALIQINGGSVSGSTRNKVFELIKHNLVHLWGSDTHSLDRRPPCLGPLGRVLERRFGRRAIELFDYYAKGVLNNEELLIEQPIPFGSGLFGG